MNKQSLLALLTISSIVLTSCGNSSTAETLSSTSTTEAPTLEEDTESLESTEESTETKETEETYQEQLDNLAKEIETATEDKEPETIAPENIIDESYVEVEEDTGASQAAFTVTPMTATLYAVKNCNIRKGPDSKAYEIIGTLNSGDAVEVTGKVDGLNWYEISLAGGKAYVSASLLQSTQPVQQPATPSSSSSTTTTTPSTPSQPSTPSTPSSTPSTPSSSDNPITYQDGNIIKYKNGDTLLDGVLYKQGEFVPGYGIDGGSVYGR